MDTSTQNRPFQPKGTAVWLIENTALTFCQISEFCGISLLEVEALANNPNPHSMKGENPLLSGQLTKKEIERCTQDPTKKLSFGPLSEALFSQKKQATKSHYIPRAKRQDRPDGIAWILKNHPLVSDYQICKLISTTPPTVRAVREKTHRFSAQIKPRDPVFLDLCTKKDLEEAITRSNKRHKKEEL